MAARQAVYCPTAALLLVCPQHRLLPAFSRHGAEALPEAPAGFLGWESKRRSGLGKQRSEKGGDMKLGLAVVLVGVFCSLSAQAGVYREGKKVMDSSHELAVVKMQWGLRDGDQDRLIGTVRLLPRLGTRGMVTMTFDVFSREVKDGAAVKIDTINVTFRFGYCGFFLRSGYNQGEFCSDFTAPKGAARITLTNVTYGGSPVTYKTDFNINNSLMKTRFRLQEPKMISTGTCSGS